MAEDQDIENVRFAILDRPACVWHPNVADMNAEFLRGIDPSFFLYQARVHQAALANECGGPNDALHAALSLRLNYGLAIEALFAMLGAVMQAPHCVFAWLTLYQPKELKTLVSRMVKGEPVKSIAFRPTSWDAISKALLGPLRDEDETQFEKVAALFARSWRQFAGDFINEQSAREYNSLKHSFRVQPSTELSFKIRVGDEDVVVSEAPFGHSFPFLRGVPGRKSHHNIHTQTGVLEPAYHLAALFVVAMSLRNATAFARAVVRDFEGGLQIKVPTDLGVFEHLWGGRAAMQNLTHGCTVKVDASAYWSDPDILAVYSDEAAV